MSFEMDCPQCGVGVIEVEETSYTRESPATRDHPGDPAEIEFSLVHGCEDCGLREQDVWESDKLLDAITEEAFAQHEEIEDDRDWTPDYEDEAREYDH